MCELAERFSRSQHKHKQQQSEWEKEERATQDMLGVVGRRRRLRAFKCGLGGVLSRMWWSELQI